MLSGCFRNQREATVSGPSLPMYIMSIKMILLTGCKSGVMPADSPTVANAEMVSNNKKEIERSGSNMHRRSSPVKIIAIAKLQMTKACCMVPEGNRFPNPFGCFLRG